METNKYEELINKLSATLGETLDIPGALYKDMNIKQLSSEELILVHTNLHRFYPTGIKDVTKQDIEQLHKEIKERIKHDKAFDTLDRVTE